MINKMGSFDIAVVVILSVAVLAVIGTIIYKKVKHKDGGCDCGCGGCSSCGRDCKKK